MIDLKHFRDAYNLSESDCIITPYGSRVYGTQKIDSDFDFLAIVPENEKITTGTEYVHGNVNVHILNRPDFQYQLTAHKIHCLEAYFFNVEIAKEFSFTLNKCNLRHELCQKSSNSFVKAKKKIDVEKTYYIGWKSLFHSLRILNFGIQIATHGQIIDFSAANHFWFEIRDACQYNWGYFKEKYQPIYNSLASTFRTLAPKEEK